MRYLIYPAALMIAQAASAQSAIEHHAWQDARSFEPISRTASAITGPITLSGNGDFASIGSTMTMTFGNGTSVELVSEGASWRSWDFLSDEKQTAEVFRMDRDPGELLNENSLCGADPDANLYAVFYEDSLFGTDPTLHLSIFRSSAPPSDGKSPGSCASFTYEIGEVALDPEETERFAPEDGGAWQKGVAVNPLDDTRTVTLYLPAEFGTSRTGDPVALVARCMSDKTEAYVIWGDYLGDDSSSVYSDWKHVTVRVGNGTARQERWGVSTNRESTFAPDWAGSFLKELLDEERLVLQTIPYGQSPVTAIFDVSGLRSVLGYLAETCDWTF